MKGFFLKRSSKAWIGEVMTATGDYFNFTSMKFIVPVFLLSLFLISCEKDIDFDLKDTEDVLVVDGSIEAGSAPFIVLTNSFDYYSNLNFDELSKKFVHDAIVTITTGQTTYRLKEYAVSGAGIPGLYYYSIDTAAGDNLIGTLDTQYDLEITTNGNTYTSSTTIPPITKGIDSLWWKQAPFTTDTTKVTVFVRSTDPPGLGDYIRYFTRTNNGPFFPGAQSVFDDQLIDGTTYDLRVDPGIDRNDPIPFEDNFFHRGDTVTLKLSNIDRTSYHFWLTMEFAYQSIGNPFSSPNTVLGNISNGALGAFVGYAPTVKTLIIDP